MAVATCAISGLPLREPVVSSKTGHVFEKALILKQIAATGQCPVTGNNLAESDLITLSGKPPSLSLSGASCGAKSADNHLRAWATGRDAE